MNLNHRIGNWANTPGTSHPAWRTSLLLAPCVKVAGSLDTVARLRSVQAVTAGMLAGHATTEVVVSPAVVFH